ncbi:MAG TPA: serine hydrolase, partial [Rhabdochlamydiaceae bacterium]|nr:serine hydrolase [Rhabdochlamydiaceae bacterium]
AFGSGVDVNQVYPLASLSKHFTFRAIEKLIEEKLLSREDKVWAYLNLSKTPLDPRVQDITIGQLLNHQGGWNADISGDPLFAANQTVLIEEVMCSSMLDFSPGAQDHYSNFGYLVLGAVIERVTGMGYLDYINQTFAQPLNLQIYQAKTPTQFTRETPFARTFQLEGTTSSLGLAATAQDLAQIVASRQKPRTFSWWLDGSLPGTITNLIRSRVNNVTIVVFIPDRDDNTWKDDNLDLRKAVDRAASKSGL